MHTNIFVYMYITKGFVSGWWGRDGSFMEVMFGLILEVLTKLTGQSLGMCVYGDGDGTEHGRSEQVEESQPQRQREVRTLNEVRLGEPDPAGF